MYEDVHGYGDDGHGVDGQLTGPRAETGWHFSEFLSFSLVGVVENVR